MFSAQGGVRISAGIPGTGLSYSKKVSGGSRKKPRRAAAPEPDEAIRAGPSGGARGGPIFSSIGGFLGWILGTKPPR